MHGMLLMPVDAWCPVLKVCACCFRQYSVDNGMRIDFKDMSKIVGETWRTLTSKERAPYEKQAKAETLQYEEERKVFEKKHKIWADLQHKAKASGQPNHAILLFTLLL